MGLAEGPLVTEPRLPALLNVRIGQDRHHRHGRAAARAPSVNEHERTTDAGVVAACPRLSQKPIIHQLREPWFGHPHILCISACLCLLRSSGLEL